MKKLTKSWSIIQKSRRNQFFSLILFNNLSPFSSITTETSTLLSQKKIFFANNIKNENINTPKTNINTNEIQNDLPLSVKQSLLKSVYVTNVLNFYEKEKDIFNVKNLIVLIKVISKLMSNLREDQEALSLNPKMIGLINTIKTNIPSMDSENLTHTLILFRKMSDRRFLCDLIKKEDYYLINNRFKDLVNQNEVNFNDASLFFSEAIYLKINTAATFKFFNQYLSPKADEIPIIEPYYLTLLIEALSKDKDYKKSEFFWRNLLLTLSIQIPKMKDINLLCRNFNYIMILDLEVKISKNLELLSVFKNLCENMITIFANNKKILLDYDILNILKGYSKAPSWLDRQFLENLKSEIVDSFEKRFSLDFKFNFLETLGNSQVSDQLDSKIADKLLLYLAKTIQNDPKSKINLYKNLTKTIALYNIPSKKEIYSIVNNKLRGIDIDESNSLIFLLIEKKMLDDDIECSDILKKTIEFFEKRLSKTFVERLAMVWDVIFHPFNKPDSLAVKFQEKFLIELFQRLENKKNSIFKLIDILGEKIKKTSVNNEKVRKFMDDVQKISDKVNPEFSLVQNIKSELFFSSSVMNPQSIIELIGKGNYSDMKFSALDIENLLKYFRNKPVKNLKNLEILIKIISNVEDDILMKNLPLLLNLIIELPSSFFQQNSAKVTNLINRALERIPNNLNLIDVGLSYQILLDLGAVFTNNGIFNFHHHSLFLAVEVLKPDFINNISFYKLLEIGINIGSSFRNSNTLKGQSHLILIESLRKIVEVEEKEILGKFKEGQNEIEIYKNSILLCRYAKLYYKAYVLDLKRKDPIFVGHIIDQV